MLKKSLFVIVILFGAVKSHAAVIVYDYSSGTFVGVPSSTASITGGLNITVTTTATGVLISASTGSAAGGVTIYPSTGTNASITRGLSVSSISFVSTSSGNIVYLQGNPFIYSTYTVIMINPGGNLITTLTDPTPQIVGLGYGAGIRVHGASDITAIGSSALANDADDTDNTAVGTNTLLSHLGIAGHIGYNTAIGSHCLDVMTDGFYNTCLGVAGFGAATGGGAHIGIGINELNLVQPGSYGDIGIGFSSLGFITTGSSNTAVGHLSGVNVLGNSSDNVFLGSQSGYNVNFATGVVMVGAIDTTNVQTALQNAISVGWDVQPISSNTAQIGGREGTGKEVNLQASSATFKNQVRTGQIIDSGLASGPVRSNSLGTLSTGTIRTDELQGQVSLSSQVVGTLPSANMATSATFYIQSTQTLQSGSTAYPAFVYIGSSGTSLGAFQVNGVLTSSGIAKFSDSYLDSAPSISFITDTLTGIGHPGTSRMVFDVGGTRYMDMNANAIVPISANSIGLGSAAKPWAVVESSTVISLSSLTVSGPLIDGNSVAGTAGQIYTAVGNGFAPTWQTSTAVALTSTQTFSAQQTFTSSNTPVTVVSGTQTYKSDPPNGAIRIKATDLKYMSMGYDPSINAGYFQAEQEGTAYRPIYFNPNGGGIGNHLDTATTARPSLGACGVSPSTTTYNTDVAGKITVGSGVVTSCTINFGTTWTNAPACNVMSGTAVTSATATTSTTQLIIGGASLTSDVLMYICMSGL